MRNTGTTKRLAAYEFLALDGGKKVAESGERQEDGCRDQARRPSDDGAPLDDGHDAVGGRAHVVGRNPSNGSIEGGRGRADTKQKGYLDEEDDERAHTSLWSAR